MLAVQRRVRLGITLAVDFLRRVGLGPLAPGRRHGDCSTAIGARPLLACLARQGVQPCTAMTNEADMLLIGDRFGRRLAAFLTDLVRFGRGSASFAAQPRRNYDVCFLAIRARDFAANAVGRDLHQRAAPLAMNGYVLRLRGLRRGRIEVFAYGVGVHGRGLLACAAQALPERSRSCDNPDSSSAARLGLSGPSSACGKPGTRRRSPAPYPWPAPSCR